MVFNLRDLLGLLGLVALLLPLLAPFGANEPSYAAHEDGCHEKNQGPNASWQLIQVIHGRGGLGGHGGGGRGSGWVGGGGLVNDEGAENGSGGSTHGCGSVCVWHIQI